MRTRLWIPDFLKGLSVFFMVQIHILETWIDQGLLEGQAGTIVRLLVAFPAAAVFMLLMGFMVGYTQPSSKKLFFRGMKLLLWGFLLNLGLNLHYIIRILLSLEEGSIISILLAVDIFYLAGFSLMVLALLKKAGTSGWLAMVLALLMVALSPTITELLSTINGGDLVLSFIGKPTDHSFFPIFPWLAYGLIGYGIAEKLFVVLQQKKVPMVVPVIITLFGIAGYFGGWHDLLFLDRYYHHGLPAFIWAIVLTSGLWMLFDHFPQIQNRGLSAWFLFLGRNVTPFYVIQWLIIGNLATFFYQDLSWGWSVSGIIIVLITTTMLVNIYNLKTKKQ